MKEERDFATLFKQAIYCLQSADIDFVVVGGSILPYYGHTRSTEDIDIMLFLDDIKDNQLQRLVEYFSEHQLSVTMNELRLGLEENVHITVFDMINFVFRLDLKRITTPLDRLSYQTRRIITLYGVQVAISGPESLVAVKSLEGFRSNTDMEDIISMIELVEFDFQILEKFLNLTGSKSFLCSYLRHHDSTQITTFMRNLGCDG
ncbi:MAG: DUF6036 family nucleotidyltransferase [Candidatus Kariarchaeaceae archaeon]|jgi:hypothetical protein